MPDSSRHKRPLAAGDRWSRKTVSHFPFARLAVIMVGMGRKLQALGSNTHDRTCEHHTPVSEIQ